MNNNKTFIELNKYFKKFEDHFSYWDFEYIDESDMVDCPEIEYWQETKMYRIGIDKLISEIKNKMYEVKDINLQTAIIKESIFYLDYFDIFYRKKELINIWNNVLTTKTAPDKPLTPKETTILQLYDLYGLFLSRIFNLCYFFGINYNEIIKQHISINCKNKDNEIFGKRYSEKDKNKLKELLSKKIVAFKELFKIPYSSDKKQKELKELLKSNGYIDNSYNWVGITKKKNELSFLYYCFKDTPGILQPGIFETQIKIFYREFGLIVYNDKEPKGYCTVKGLKNDSPDNETYQNFKMKFSEWIK